MKRRFLVFVSYAMLSVWNSGAQPQQAGNLPTGQRANEGAGSTLFGNVCGTCHGKIDQAPPPAILKQMTPERIYQSLTTGNMRNQARAANLTDPQIRDIAEWVGGRKLSVISAEAKDMPNPCPATPAIKDMTSRPAWNGWSNDLSNRRFQSAKAAGLSAAGVSRLELKWAFAFPNAAQIYGQPTIVDGRVFTSADTGYVYSLDAVTGCVHWSFQAQAGVASAVTLALRPGTTSQYGAYFGDYRGNVYAVDASNGELLWKIAVDPHPLSRIRGAMKIYGGRLYVPVASLEEPESSSFNYPCCTFRGMVVALNAATGKQIWKTYMIDEKPTPRKTSTGISFMGPAGAGVWGPTMIDPKRRAVYVSTGNAFSEPDVGRGDAVVAMDMDTGKILWAQQDEVDDVWHTGCPKGPAPPGFPPRNIGGRGGRGGAGRGGAGGRGGQAPPPSYYCPETPKNPDWDFSAGVIQANLRNGKSLLLAGQKSGIVWAHDPDNKGAMVWRSDISRGEIVFGGAADDENAYFAMRSGGVAAIRLEDGLERWYTPVTPQESMSTHGGHTAAVTLIPGVLLVPGLDGMLRAFNTFDGRLIWSYDTTQEFKAVNGISAKGGSMGAPGPTVAGGMVYVTSGYAGFQGGLPGNVLLAFGPPN